MRVIKTFLNKYVFRFIDGYTQLMMLIGGGFVILLLILVNVGVISRYIFNRPLDWTLEGSMAAAVFIFFLPMAHDLKHNIHPTMDTVTRNISAWRQNFVMLFNQVVCLMFSVILLVSFWILVSTSFETRRTVESIRWLNMGVIQFGMILGIVGLLLYLLSHLFFTFRDTLKKKPVDFTPKLTIGD